MCLSVACLTDIVAPVFLYFFLFVVWSPALMGIVPSGRLLLWQINTLSLRVVVSHDIAEGIAIVHIDLHWTDSIGTRVVRIQPILLLSILSSIYRVLEYSLDSIPEISVDCLGGPKQTVFPRSSFYNNSGLK